MQKKDVIDFLKELKGSQDIEFSDLRNVVDWNSAYGGSPVYWLAGGKKKNARRKDEDIVMKKYFYVDIDIRLSYREHHGVVLDDDGLMEEFTKIISIIDGSQFADYYAVVLSGNGCHLYYKGEERAFDLVEYSNGVKAIYEQIDKVLSDTIYATDHACSNIGRIARLPGSYNQRKKIKKDEVLRDLGPYEVQLLQVQNRDSLRFAMIENEGKKMVEKRNEEKELMQKIKQEAKLWQPKQSDDIRSEINSIPVADVAEIVRGVTCGADNGEIITLKEPKKNMGAYVYKPKNIIVNQGSSLVKTNRKTFTSFEVVCFELFGGDTKQTMQFFKDRYGIVKKEEKKQELREKPMQVIAKDEMDFETKKNYTRGNLVVDMAFGPMSNDLVVVAALPGMGKTTWTNWIAQQNGKQGVKVAYYTLELSPKALKERYAFSSVGLTKYEYMKRLYTEEQRQKMAQKYKEFDQHFDLIGFDKMPTIDDLQEEIEKKAKEGYEMFFIDNLDKIEKTDQSIQTNEQQKIVSGRLQTLKNKLGICVVLIHHYNKAKKGELGGSGGMHKVSGSQKIADNATIMVDIYRETDGDVKEKVTTIQQYKDTMAGVFGEVDLLRENGEYKERTTTANFGF